MRPIYVPRRQYSPCFHHPAFFPCIKPSAAAHHLPPGPIGRWVMPGLSYQPPEGALLCCCQRCEYGSQRFTHMLSCRVSSERLHLVCTSVRCADVGVSDSMLLPSFLLLPNPLGCGRPPTQRSSNVPIKLIFQCRNACFALTRGKAVAAPIVLACGSCGRVVAAWMEPEYSGVPFAVAAIFDPTRGLDGKTIASGSLPG